MRTSPPSCDCQWWYKHAGDRGPCKHILAAILHANQPRTAHA
ncbi:MAG: SWIM zinc finger family protein [Solirubrobacteraceae bacterium]